MVEYGPIQMLALGFPDIDNLKGDLIKEIVTLSDAKLIRIIGLLALAKDKKGNLADIQMTQLSADDRVKLGAAIGALIGYGAAGDEGAHVASQAMAGKVAEKAAHNDFGLNEKQIKNIAKDIPNGTAVGFLLFEHLWAKKFKDIAMNVDGVVLANGFINRESLMNLGAQLADGVKTAKKLK
jgi:uncharacterized membrane protein